MDRRNFLGGLIAMPAIIRVADIMRVKPVRYSFTDVECSFVFDNSIGKGAITLSPWEDQLPIRNPYIVGMIWNDHGTIRISDG